MNALSTRAATTVERASVACLLLDLYTTLGQNSRAVAIGLEYLRHLGVEWSLHPTDEDVRREYERFWKKLGNRTIEDLIELPLMTDPASLATMDVLTNIPPAFLRERNLYALAMCWAVNLSLVRGNSDGSCATYVQFGCVVGISLRAAWLRTGRAARSQSVPGPDLSGSRMSLDPIYKARPDCT